MNGTEFQMPPKPAQEPERKNGKETAHGTENSRAFVFTGGPGFCPERMTDLPRPDDFIIAADAGCAALEAFSAKVCKISPDLILGDMDSYGRERLKTAFPGAAFLPFPPEKDDTDTRLAVSEALARSCREIVIAGGLGGRLDHTLANVFLLLTIQAHGARGILTDGKNRAYLAAPENRLDGRRKYVSLIPLDDEIGDVRIDDGFRYPYQADVVQRSGFITVSNEVLRPPAVIRIGAGSALIVETED